ncbi:unnamed protein product, partial [Medioppia subpectinata]
MTISTTTGLARYYAGHRPVLTVAEPELLKNIMIRDFNSFTDRNFELLIDPVLNRNVAQASGDDWKRLRQIISPAFSSGRMKRMYPSIRECLRDFTAHLDAYARDGRPMNAKEMFGNFTMDVVATCAFATKTNIHNDPNNPVTTTVKPEGLQYFNDLMSNIITTRKEMPDSSAKYSDFLQLLMDARNDRVAAHESAITDESGTGSLKPSAPTPAVPHKQMSDDEVRANTFVILMSAYETTATTLTIAMYELALQPRLQERLYAELKAAMDADGEIDYDTLQALTYLDQVVSETLRLHPPGIRATRLATQDYKLGDTGIVIRKGQQVDIPTYAIHHSPENYPDPYRYDPDRFSPANRGKIKPYTYA